MMLRGGKADWPVIFTFSECQSLLCYFSAVSVLAPYKLESFSKVVELFFSIQKGLD
jgi:hypothetical protein